MAITNHANPKTAKGMAYFFPTATFTVGTTTPQKMPAAAVYGSINTLLTVHINMRTIMSFIMCFLHNVIKLSI